MLPLGEVVDWEGLLEVLWSSFAAGLVVTVAASLAILGATRAVDMRRAGHPVPAGLFSIVGVFGALLLAAAVVFGVVVMTAQVAQASARSRRSTSSSLFQAPTEART